MKQNQFCHSQGQQSENPLKDSNSSGHWLFRENLLYAIFLQINKALMGSKKQRKNRKIFQQMAEFISTRNSLQCRSHHQKLLEKMNDTKVILSNFKKNVGVKYFKRQYANFLANKELQMPTVEQKSESIFKQTPVHLPSQEISQVQLDKQQGNLFSHIIYFVPIYDWSIFVPNTQVELLVNYNV